MMPTTIALRLFVLVLAAAALPAASAPPTGGRQFGPATAVFEADLGQRSEADRQSIELWLQPAAGAHRFAGTTAYLAVHSRAVTAADAARLFAATGPAPDAVDAWRLADGRDERIPSALGRVALSNPNTYQALDTAPRTCGSTGCSPAAAPSWPGSTRS